MASHYRIHGTVTDYSDIDPKVADKIERIIGDALMEAGFSLGGFRVAVTRETKRRRALAKRLAKRAPRVAAALESLRAESVAKAEAS